MEEEAATVAAGEAIGAAGTKLTTIRGALLAAPSTKPLARCTKYLGARGLTDKYLNKKDTHGK